MWLISVRKALKVDEIKYRGRLIYRLMAAYLLQSQFDDAINLNHKCGLNYD